MIFLNISVNKIYEKHDKNKKGEDYTLYTFYGNEEDGADFKSSCFSPIGDDVKEGKVYSFETEMSGKYSNIVRVSEENGTLEETPENTKKGTSTLPPGVTSKPQASNTKVLNQDKQPPAGKPVENIKEKNIRISVALNDATLLMNSLLASKKEEVKADSPEEVALEVTVLADIFLEWLILKGDK